MVATMGRGIEGRKKLNGKRSGYQGSHFTGRTECLTVLSCFGLAFELPLIAL